MSSDGSEFGRHRSTKWRRKRRRGSSSSGDTVENIDHSSSDPPSNDVSPETTAVLENIDHSSSDPPSNDVSPETTAVLDEANDNGNYDLHQESGSENGNNLTESDSDFGLISEEEEENQPMFMLNEGEMNAPLVVHGHATVKEALVLELALFLRHKNTYENLLDNFSVKNLLFGTKYFPSSKKELFRLLGRSDSGMVAYVYCVCGNLLGKKCELDAVVSCGCERDVVVAEAKLFFVFSLKQQFKQFLETPGIPEQLEFRNTRRKHDENAIEDVYDGKRYKEMRLRIANNDYTFVLNTDGCRIGKKAQNIIYPVFARVNELPPNLRQKHIFIIGLYGDKCDPNMESFLSPVVDEINCIAREGVVWHPNGDLNNEPRVSRFFLYCFCVDGKASSQILNMVPHNSDFACSSCTFKGVRVNGTQRYPAEPHPLIPPYEDRTHEKMVQDMWKAHRDKKTVTGHKGLSALLAIDNFDLVEGKGFDDLHFFYECAAKHHFELLLKEAPREIHPISKEPLAYAVIERIINARFSKIKTPSVISRKAPNMVLKNREQFTGTEWRNILLYYGVPCLKGVIKASHVKHFEMLSNAAHAYSRNGITEEEIVQAEQLIDKYLVLYDQYYGIETTRLNLHVMKHAGNSVRTLGPLFAYSTFNFESWNRKLLLHIKSARGFLLQIAVRHFIRSFLECLSASATEDMSDAVKEKIQEVLQVHRPRKTALKIEEHVYVMDADKDKILTDAERNIIERERGHVVSVQFYQKMILNGCEYQTEESLKPNELSDNSMFYSRQNTFCTIKSIIVCEDQSRTKTAGLLVFEHDVPPNQRSHIIRLFAPTFDLIHFVDSHMVMSPVVKIRVNDELNVVPVPNTFEID